METDNKGSGFHLLPVFSKTLVAMEYSLRKKLLTEFFERFPYSIMGNDQAKYFPFFLSEKKWPQNLGFLPDLSALEWSLFLARIAPSLSPKGFERVVTASEPEWFKAQFRFDPAHAVMHSDWPLEEIWINPQGMHSRNPGKFLLYRHDERPCVRRIDRNEARLLEALNLGVPLGVILEKPGGPEFDAFLFHEWIQSGLLREIHWAENRATV
jgi:hypothetical protein